MEQINLNLIPNGILAVCHVSQYDNTGRKIRFHLFNGSDTYALSGTETITLRIRKTNGEILIFDIPNTASDYIDLTVLQQMTDVSGDSVCEFRLTDSGLDIGSFNFKMKIEPDAFDGNLSISEVSGNIATFKTDLAEDLIKLDVDLEPIQDLHGYDGTWPVGSGKNKFPPSLYDTTDFTVDANGVYTQNNPASAGWALSWSKRLIDVTLPAGTYTLTCFAKTVTTNSAATFIIIDENGTAIQSKSMTSKTSESITRTFNETTKIGVVAKIYDGAFYFQLESGSTSTSWTPYSNICPISGHDSAQLFRTGKNVWDEEWEIGTISPNTGANVVNPNKIRSKNLIPVSPDTSYRFVALSTTNDSDFIYFYDENGNYLSYITYTHTTIVSYVFTTPANCRYIRFILKGTTYNHDISINYPATFTDYEPYLSEPTPITVQFGQTVYKGKLYSELRKVLVTHVCETYDGSSDEEWVNHSATSVRYGFRIYFQHDKKATAQAIDEMLSSVIPLRKSSETTSVDDDIITCRSTTYLHKIFYIFAPPSKISTVEELRAFLANEPETVMYPLNEPFYIDLSQEQTEDVERAAIASFETNIQRPLETAEHYFSCSQAEGTPTPDNPIPIDGVSEITAYRTGKNLIDNDDFFIFQSWKPNLVTVGEFPTNYSNRGYKLPTKVGETYTISFGIDENDIPRYVYLCKTDGITSTRVTYITTGSALFNRTFTFTSDGSLYYLRSGSMIDQSAFEEQIGKIDFVQLELGSTATPYEPYSGESITVSLGGTYYGGKLVQKEDGSRKIVLDKAFTKINALTWSYVPSFAYFNAYPTNLKQNSDAGKKLDGLTSDIYTNRNATQAGSGDIDLSIAGYQTAIRIKHKAYTDVNSFVTAVGDHDIVYPLATPVEIDLPDGDPLTTLAGENNVYCNTGDTALTYYFNMVADPIRIPALVGTNNVYSDAGDVDVEYYTTLEGGND